LSDFRGKVQNYPDILRSNWDFSFSSRSSRVVLNKDDAGGFAATGVAERVSVACVACRSTNPVEQLPESSEMIALNA
jgi:hypothetical protein